jgi:hypothetical protein
LHVGVSLQIANQARDAFALIRVRFRVFDNVKDVSFGQPALFVRD